jgi:hypothetical protein
LSSVGKGPRLNSSTLILGETKAGKTTLLATAAEWLWEEHRKVLFLCTAELGGFSARVEQRIRQGLIRPWRMRTRDDEANSLSFETLHLASKGYVPARFVDALTGEVERGVPLVAPTTTVYTQYCGECDAEVQRTRFRSKLKAATCPGCRKPVTLQNSRSAQTTMQTPGFEAIGSFGYDGLTSFSDWLLQDMSHRKNLEGEKAALGGDIESGSLTFRGNNRSQVGMAQTRIHELVANSLGIPNLIVMPFWTAISHESSDDTGRLTVIGPKLAGDAKTYIAPSWFGNCTEAIVATNDRGEYIRRLYVSQWYDNSNRRHLCGHRGDPRFMQTFYEDEPYTDEQGPRSMCTGFSLAFFLREIEQSIQKGIAADDMPDVPGMAAIPASYGDVAEEAQEVASSTTGTGRPVAGPRVAARRAVAAPRKAAATSAATSAAASAAVAAPVETGVDVESVSPVAAAAEPEQAPAEPDAPSRVAAAPAAAPAAPTPTAVPPTAVPVASGSWARPAGAKPAPPRAPQAGPKPPYAVPRPVRAAKPS